MTEKGTTVTFAGDWSQPATKLIEKVSDALGSTFRPHQIRRIAKAEADAKIEHARADLKIEAMRKEDELELIEFRERTLRRMVAREVARQINTENILTAAAQRLSETAQKQEVHPEEIEESFVQDLFAQAENVSDAKLQEIWASILANKASTNAHVSKKTMQILASMDSADAEVFEEFSSVCGTVAGTTQCLTGPKALQALETRAIKFPDLKHLEALGLLEYNTLTGFNFQFDAPSPTFLLVEVGKKKLSIQVPQGPGIVQMGNCLLTQAGRQILSAIKPRYRLLATRAVIEDLQEQGLKISEL